MTMARQQDRKGYQRAVTGFRRDTRGVKDAGTLLRRSAQVGTLGEAAEDQETGQTAERSELLEKFAAELAKGIEGRIERR